MPHVHVMASAGPQPDMVIDATLKDVESAVCEVLGKPLSYVQSAYTQATKMRFGGQDGNTVWVQVNSIGKIGPATNPALAQAITKAVCDHLPVPANRV
mmetsp:Transcript_14886/g.35482  ORF Transcript_14886/g.35482 Transcript_14886/m.35482 type:complete len:98 (-) Transcript_14886:733-1026(-)